MATDRKMRLGLSIGILGYHYAAWRLPETPLAGDLDFDHFLNCARIAQAGKFDFLFFADVAAVRNLDDPRIARNREQSHIHLEPTLLVSALAAATSHVGFVPTVSTTFHHPYNMGRRLASIDHISGGRAGWNMVTSTNPDEARNFNLDAPLDSDTRHARAREFVDVITGLWDSWDDDAFVRDKASGQYFTPGKFHYLEHEGPFFKVRGPLDTARPIQGRLPMASAGTSPNAQDLSAELADIVYAGQPKLEGAREYYASVKARTAKFGRRPEDVRVMPGIMPFVGRTQAEAQAKFDRVQALLDPAVGVGMLVINHFPDLTGHPLDEPLPPMEMNAIHSTASREPTYTLELMERARRERLTLRQVFEIISAGFWHLGVIGTPESVADTMEEWFTTGAADGFIVQPPYLPDAAQDFVELVLPELRQRGLFREEYEATTLRGNLGLPPAPSRYAPSGAAAAE